MNVKRTFYSEYGVKRIKGGTYVCHPFYDNMHASIRFINSITGENLDYQFKDEDFYGKVACVLFTDLDNKFDSYVFFENSKVSPDNYTRGINVHDGSNRILKELRIDKSYSPVRKAFSDTYIYLSSVKGQTMLDNSIKKDKGTFKALEKKIPYFKDLGVTALMLMPVYEAMEDKTNDYRVKPGTKKANFWGFGNGLHFAINSELSVSDDTEGEFSDFVNKLHKEELECILIIQFTGNETKEYITDVLKHYAFNFNVDGFRIIGPNIDFDSIIRNPLFANTKLIYDSYEFNKFRPVKPVYYKNVGFLDTDYINMARRFCKGDEDFVRRISFKIRENPYSYAPIHGVTDFNGFTLNDLVSYNVKHNELNGEENQDGTDYNYSWNCGEEGVSKKKSVNALRSKMIKNLTIMEILTQGVPLIRGGDELLNTQYGNNNPYCQDNEIGYVKFRKDKTARSYFKFLKNLIEFRKRHVILHQPKELSLSDYMSIHIPDVSFHGTEAYRLDQNPVSHAFGIMYCGDYAKQYKGEKEDSIYIAYNMYWEDVNFSLPVISKDKKWELLYCTNNSFNEEFDESKSVPLEGNAYILPQRTISILILKS